MRHIDNIYEHGKIPPQCLDLEEAVLGAMMLEPARLLEIIEMVKPEMFYKENHQIILSSIQRLFAKNDPVDILTVTEDLRQSGELELVGGPYFITMLTNRVAGTSNIETHARIIQEKFFARELIRIGSSMVKEGYEDTTDIFDLIDSTEKEILNLRSGTSKKTFRQIDAPLQEYYKSIEAGMKTKNKLRGVPSGFRELDRTTGGWQNSDLIILASRPGMGKTSFGLTVARNAVMDFKKPTGLFSLEMSEVQLIQRLISGEADITSPKLRNYDLDEQEIIKVAHRIQTLLGKQLFIDDTPALSIFDFQAKARRMKALYGIELIVLDYLQLMRGSKENKSNREREISEISQCLKATAKDLNIPIIALSQLSRKVEERGRGEKRPILSDLRESGAIEQDADIVLFLFRPSYYMKQDNPDYDRMKDVLEIIIAKNRNGPTRDDLILKFIKEYTKVVDFNSIDEGMWAEDKSRTTQSKIFDVKPEDPF